MRAHWLVWSLIGLCVAVEALLWAGPLLDASGGRLRQQAYEYGGFWPGLLQGWDENFPGQSWAMFVSYGFLHGGPGHMAVNMVTLWSLGQAVIARVGARGFALLYGASLLGGAAGFGLIAETFRPMVGASGALFGLAGGLLAWNYVDRFTLEAKLWPVARTALFLVAMNVAMWWALDGQLAWETHLGGFIIGWIMALLIDPRGRGGPADDAAAGPG